MTDRSLGNQQGFLKPFWDGLSFCCCCLTTEHDRSPSLSKQVKFHAAGYPVGFLGDQDEPMPPSSWDRAGRVDYPTELAGPGAGTLHAGCWLAVSWCFLLCSVAVPAGERAVAPQTDAEKELNSHPAISSPSKSQERRWVFLTPLWWHVFFFEIWPWGSVSTFIQVIIGKEPNYKCLIPMLHGWFLLYTTIV